MIKFTVLMVLLAVAAVQSKKYYGGCTGSLCGGGLALGGVAVAAAPAAVAAAPAVVAAAPAVVAAAPAVVAAAPAVVAAPVVHAAPLGPVAVRAVPPLAVAPAGYGGYGYGYGLDGIATCVDTLSGCGGYVGLGYCGQAYYANGCCNSCGLLKKKK